MAKAAPIGIIILTAECYRNVGTNSGIDHLVCVDTPLNDVNIAVCGTEG